MEPLTVVIVSGGVGYSAEQLVRAALAQFPGADATVLRAAQARRPEQLSAAVAQAAEAGALIAHTLVDSERRGELADLARARGVPEVDLIGPLLGQLSRRLGRAPLGEPGRYDAERSSYLSRIAAIEYTLAHDDGAHPEGWGEADMLLVGVSRVGKTPLSIYLAVLGWRVANLPLVRELPPPRALFELDRRRVVGLTIGLEQLVEHRRLRQRHLAMPGESSYASPAALAEELERSDRLFRRCGFPVVDVTSKPLESIANEVTALLGRRLA